jgi:hypothetical protein
MLKRIAVGASGLTSAVCATAQARTRAAVGVTLYLQQAQGGTLTGRTLTVRGVDARTTTFQNRPQRTAGSQLTRSFVAGFART